MATIKEIAALAGVSRGTVDRVLNDRGAVNPETAEKIRKIAKELDYKENHNEITYDPDKTYYITMLGGLPPAHMEDARLKDNFKAYFKTSDAQYVWYKGRTWD